MPLTDTFTQLAARAVLAAEIGGGVIVAVIVAVLALRVRAEARAREDQR